MHEGDFNWRILHGAISTAKFCFRSDRCPYCGKQDDKGNNKITELRTILQRESQNS